MGHIKLVTIKKMIKGAKSVTVYSTLGLESITVVTITKKEALYHINEMIKSGMTHGKAWLDTDYNELRIG